MQGRTLGAAAAAAAGRGYGGEVPLADGLFELGFRRERRAACAWGARPGICLVGFRFLVREAGPLSDPPAVFLGA